MTDKPIKTVQQGFVKSQQHDSGVMLPYGSGSGVALLQAIDWYEPTANGDDALHARVRAEVLSRMYAGEADPQYTDQAQVIYWKKRAGYVEKTQSRSHPHWFYS